jgi:Ni/Co efflux regulator RcnB
MLRRSWLLAIAAAVLAASSVAAAGTSVVFSSKEVSIIRDYYAHAPQDAGKGAQKKQKGKPLPPGIAKNLQRGKPLPPGIAKQQLPADLARRLPPVQPGYERVSVDGRVLLLETATQVIHDVLEELIF